MAVSYLGRRDLAHVQPHDLTPDNVGRGNHEGNLPEVTDAEALEVVGRFASQGFVRRNLLVLRGNRKKAGETAEAQATMAGLCAVSAAVGGNGGSVVFESGDMGGDAFHAGGHRVEQLRSAKMQGYEGDPCEECGNFTMVRNGTCLKCMTCGSTSGCS